MEEGDEAFKIPVVNTADVDAYVVPCQKLQASDHEKVIAKDLHKVGFKTTIG